MSNSERLLQFRQHDHRGAALHLHCLLPAQHLALLHRAAQDRLSGHHPQCGRHRGPTLALRFASVHRDGVLQLAPPLVICIHHTLHYYIMNIQGAFLTDFHKEIGFRLLVSDPA